MLQSSNWANACDGAPAGIRTRDKRLETSCDNPFTTGAHIIREYGISKRIRSIEEIQKRMPARSSMILRQRFGVVLVILFLPINGPLWRMAVESMGMDFPFGEFSFMVLSVMIFTIGCVMILAPKIRFFHKP